MWRPTGIASALSPSRTASLTRPGRDDSICAARSASASICSRARSSVAWTSLGLDATLRGRGQTLLRALDCGLVHSRKVPWPPDGMKVSELDYELPPELIAQRPAERRDDSRLLVYDRASGEVRHRRFSELPEELTRGELVVANDTRVVPARIPIEQPRGEVLLLERRGRERRLGGARAADEAAPRRPALRAGRAARAPRRGALAAAARRRAGRAGAAAAVHHRAARRPRALPDGLRATRPARPPRRPPGCTSRPSCSARLDVEYVTLHVGLDTFRPVAVEDLAEHRLHGERYSRSARGLGADRGGRARARRRDDDRPRARVGRARARRWPAAPSSSSRRASSSAASTRC